MLWCGFASHCPDVALPIPPPQTLDRERVSTAEERRGLAEDRVAAMRAADEARASLLRLSEAVRAWASQGVPIPFVVDGERKEPNKQ